MERPAIERIVLYQDGPHPSLPDYPGAAVTVYVTGHPDDPDGEGLLDLYFPDWHGFSFNIPYAPASAREDQTWHYDGDEVPS